MGQYSKGCHNCVIVISIETTVPEEDEEKEVQQVWKALAQSSKFKIRTDTAKSSGMTISEPVGLL